jgi:ABC-type transport system involved in multi-copper enzyme maturation permease subunit
MFHAARDTDLQFRRTYILVGGLFLIGGILVTALPIKGPSGTQFLPWGYLCLMMGLLFLLPSVRNETDPKWHTWSIRAMGFVGGVLALAGFIFANVWDQFLIPYGLLLTVLGLGYLWAFVGLLGVSDDLGYRVGMGIGVLGVLAFLVALGRSFLPQLFHSWGWISRPTEGYFASTGFLLMMLGLLYASLSALLCSDHRLAVLTRRELAAFFFSPIAYIVLFGFTVVGVFQFWYFISEAVESSLRSQPMVEPIIMRYIFSLVPVILIIFIVPLLTMRLLSEEHRTGTLEVLLTAPLDETYIVISKFLASLLFFVLIWVPWGLLLIALRLEGDQPFDYRPLYSFGICLAFSGVGFLSMGLFFSSITRNQIVAAVLTFMGMMLLLFCYFIKFLFPEGSTIRTMLTYASYTDHWYSTLQGKLSFTDIMFNLSFGIFWLFLTVKVMESRKWK